MYRKQNRTKELARRTFVYAVMTLSLVALLIFCTLNILGYTFDTKTKEIQQTGLVQFNSYPTGATVLIDGAEFRKTQTKNTVLPGSHTFTMRLDGYEQWQKTLSIKSGTVTHLTYVRMVPKQRTETTVKTFQASSAASLSADGKYLFAISGDTSSPVVTIGALQDTSAEKFTDYSIDASIIKGGATGDSRTLSVTEWDQSNRYILVKNSYQESGQSAVQWLRFDREKPAEVIDVTKLTGLTISQAHFIGTSGNELYILQDNGDLRTVNTNDATISSPIISNVISFQPYGTEYVSYIAVSNEKKTAGLWKKGWQQPRVIYTTTADGHVSLLTSHYFRKDTVAITNKNGVTIYRGTLENDDTKWTEFMATARTISNDAAASLAISDNGQFIMLRNNSAAQTYDLEREEMSQPTDIKGAFGWIDNFHIWHTSDEGLVMQDFDGANAHQLTKVSAHIDTSLSSNQNYLYVLDTVNQTVVLKKISMTASAS